MSKIIVEFSEDTMSINLDDVTGAQIEKACAAIINTGIDRVQIKEGEGKTEIFAYIIAEVVHETIAAYIGARIKDTEDQAEKMKEIHNIPNVELLLLIDKMLYDVQQTITIKDAHENQR